MTMGTSTGGQPALLAEVALRQARNSAAFWAATGEMFPMALLDEPGVDVFAARLDGEVAGACVTVVDSGFASHYWVGTPPAYRSRGVGRAVMLGSLAHLAHLPVTLTASRLGRPLYESLGFTVAAPSTWRSSV